MGIRSAIRRAGREDTRRARRCGRGATAPSPALGRPPRRARAARGVGAAAAGDVAAAAAARGARRAGWHRSAVAARPWWHDEVRGERGDLGSRAEGAKLLFKAGVWAGSLGFGAATTVGSLEAEMNGSNRCFPDLYGQLSSLTSGLVPHTFCIRLSSAICEQKGRESYHRRTPSDGGVRCDLSCNQPIRSSDRVNPLYRRVPQQSRVKTTAFVIHIIVCQGKDIMR